ncbi:ShlB/FhaC/HecB family hemolysin secretion/activation protein [Trinickia symbiotica]|uniref:ShlB/FhaC/HecB family hemolysin secretion/activation protein n=1 Tax=Trinickia symbiotica TaxID=863227 RepID=UPI002159730A|nr:ShlB/FhaC/HecB family hemolysin secretion/activation protein [Trinickia symbiotica]
MRVVFGLALAVTLADAGPAWAQAYRDVQPSPPPAAVRPSSPPAPPADAASSQRIAVETLRSLTFVADAATAKTEGNASTRVADGAITAIQLPVLDASFLERFAADLGKPLTFARLVEIRRAVEQRFRDAGEPLVDAYTPEQDVTAGGVTIVVAQFHVGEVRARGNRYFSDALLAREMPLTPGGTIRDGDVALGLAMLNANPYRTVDVIYEPGSATNSTDVVLQTQDRLPLRIIAGYDNDGVPQLGRDRFFAGIDYGNLFGLDQQINYRVTASNDVFGGNPDIEGRPDRPRLVAHALSYSAPLPWLDRIELFGMYAQSTPRMPDNFSQTGISAQLSARYDWQLPPFGRWQQQVQFGYDFKRSNNDLEFGGFQVFNANTHIHQFSITWNANRADASGTTSGNAIIVFSPGHLDGSDSDAAFQAARSGATSRYTYLQLSGQRDMKIGAGFSWWAHGIVQWTPNTLLPSEALALGGEASVRGYDPYAMLGDRGWNVQTELRTPPFVFGSSSAAVQPYLFVDAGHAWNRINEPFEPHNGMLVSLGVGLRFQFSRYVNLRATWGVPLRPAVPNGSTAPMGMLSLVVGS